MPYEKILSIYEDDWYLKNKNLIIDYCKDYYNHKDSLAGAENIYHENWEEKSNTLPYLIYKSNQFKENGDFFIKLYCDNKVQKVAMTSGVYISDFDKNVAVINVRFSVAPFYLGVTSWFKKPMTPYVTNWAIKNNCKAVLVTVNEYNRKILPVLVRTGLSTDNKVEILPFPIYYKYTKQYCCYSYIDKNYEIDWECLKYKE
jgi:hypothetical protein